MPFKKKPPSFMKFQQVNAIFKYLVAKIYNWKLQVHYDMNFILIIFI